VYSCERGGFRSSCEGAIERWRRCQFGGGIRKGCYGERNQRYQVRDYFIILGFYSAAADPFKATAENSSSHAAHTKQHAEQEAHANQMGTLGAWPGAGGVYLLSHDSILLDGAVTVVGITQRLDCCARDRQHRELHQTLLRACTSVPTGCRSERLFLGHYTVMWRDRVWEIRTCSGKLAHAGDADQDQLFPIISANVNHDSDILSAMLYTDQPE